MRKSLILALLLTFSIGCWAQLQGDTYAAAKQSKKATWTLTYSDSPGLATLINSKPDGICYDLMEEFAKYVKTKTGIEVTLNYAKVDDPANFTAFLTNVKQSKGGVFGLSNTTITEERKKSYNFSPAFLKNVSMIITHNSIAEVTDLKNVSSTFGSLKAVVVKGSTNEARVLELKKKYLPNLTIDNSPSFLKSIDAVVADKNVLTSADFTYYLKALQARKPIKRHAIFDETGEEFGIIMPLSNDWNGLLTEFMKSGFIESSQYNKIITDHLGQSVLTFIKKIK
jgi:ABC-type amino acid transport substrate-binding protein